MSKFWQVLLAVLCGLVVVGGVAAAVVFERYPDADVPLIAGIAAACLGAVAFLAIPAGRSRKGSVLLAVLVLAAFAGARYLPQLLTPESDEPEKHAEFNGDISREQSQANLERALRIARESIENLNTINGYTCDFAKHEWAKNVFGVPVLSDEKMKMMIRHKPFSVYTQFVEPEAKRGTEAIYVDGANDGNMTAHATDPLGKRFGRIVKPPDHWMLMIDNRHPITSAGMKNLLHKLLRLADEQEENLKNCQIKISEDKQVDGRPCIGLEIYNPKSNVVGFEIARAQIFLDKEWNVPTHYESRDWVKNSETGEYEEKLMESYTYTNVRFNPGLTDEDFDPDNPNYDFP